MTPDTEDATPRPESTEMDPELTRRSWPSSRPNTAWSSEVDKKDVTTIAQLVEDCRRSYPHTTPAGPT